MKRSKTNWAPCKEPTRLQPCVGFQSSSSKQPQYCTLVCGSINLHSQQTNNERIEQRHNVCIA